MSTTATTTPAGAAAARPRRPKAIGGPALGSAASAQARQWAAAILEVLAGARTPAQAAAALGAGLPRYYQVEARAVRGLLAACEPPPVGRVRRPESEVRALRLENQRLQRELARQQALVRATQRTVGLAAPAAGKTTPRRRRRVARALSVAARLQAQTAAPAAAPAVSPSS